MFESNHVFIGSIEKGAKNQIAEWKFKEGVSSDFIERVQPGCGCTNALITKTGILASFNEEDVIRWNEEDLDRNRVFYPDGFPADKQVTLFLKDGRPEQLPRFTTVTHEDGTVERKEEGGTYPNPEKDRLVLTFSVLIKF